MKKSIVMAVALAAFATVGCSEVETTQIAKQNAIGFDAFANKASRISATELGWNNFSVFGQYGSVNVFNGVNIIYNTTNSAWEYNPLQLWVPGQEYVFGAVAPATPGASFDYANKTYSLPGTITLNQETQKDWLTATPVTVTSGATNDVVSFTFNHITSKLGFVFKVDKETANAWPGEIYIKIIGFKMSAIEQTASYSNDTWDNYGQEKATFSTVPNLSTSWDGFDVVTATSTREFFVLPQTLTQQQVELTCDITDEHGTAIKTNVKAKANLATSHIIEWEPGSKYVYTFLLGSDLLSGSDDDDVYILFNVEELSGWTEVPESVSAVVQ